VLNIALRQLHSLTLFEREVVHHLQPSYYEQIRIEVIQLLLKLLHGVQIWIMVITMDNIPTAIQEKHLHAKQKCLD